MPVRILSVAFPFALVGPQAVGGAEHVLNSLDRAIVASGDTSLVVACAGSNPRGRLFPIELPQKHRLDTTARLSACDWVQPVIDRVLESEDVDLIHIHAMDFYQYRTPLEIPVLVTLHLPFSWYRNEIWNELPPNVQLCCVSESQRRSGPSHLQEAPVIENGITLPEFRPGKTREPFALVLGRICPEKNAHEALIAGSMAGMRVLLAGQVFPFREHIEYFHHKIKPLLRGGGIEHRFLGPIDSARRDQLLSRAKCLLHPTRAPETSSLVAMEAMATGTPVIAYRSGALNEIVEDGVTGFLVNDGEEMADAIREVGRVSSDVCRAVAERRFDSARMARQYFEIYDALLHRSPAKKSCYA